MAFPHPAVTLSLSAQDFGCCYSSHIHPGLPCFSLAPGASPLPSGSSASLTPYTVVGVLVMEESFLRVCEISTTKDIRNASGQGCEHLALKLLR